MDGKAVRLVLECAAEQHGVFRLDQARHAQLSRRQLDYRASLGHWTRLAPNVYRAEGAPETWFTRLRAALLWAEPRRTRALRAGYALSHRTAAALHGFTRFPEGPVEVSVTRGLRPCRGIVLHRVKVLPEKDITVVNGLRVTTALRTLIDLAAVADADDVRASVDQALSRKWFNLEQFERAVTRARGQRGVAFLNSLVREYQGGDGPSESELESRVLEVLEAAGLPRPQRQHSVRAGGRLRRLDFLIPGTRVVIEAEGFAHHSSPKSFEEDRRRNNALVARGFRVLHWTWQALHEDPQRLVQELLVTLAR